VGVEGDDPITVRQPFQSGPRLIPQSSVVLVADVAPGVLLLEPLEACREASALLSRVGELRLLCPATQLAPCRVDDRLGQDCRRDGGQDLGLETICR
jgi:hypothetical protein